MAERFRRATKVSIKTVLRRMAEQAEQAQQAAGLDFSDPEPRRLDLFYRDRINDLLDDMFESGTFGEHGEDDPRGDHRLI